MRPLIPTTEPERIRLIGELLCKGILCSPSLRADAASATGSPTVNAGEPEQRIVDYLRRHQAASPAEMRAVLNLSRSRTYRSLQRLLFSRQVVANGGRTSAAAYRLADFDPSRN
jgi:hypothetical protein